MSGSGRIPPGWAWKRVPTRSITPDASGTHSAVGASPFPGDPAERAGVRDSVGSCLGSGPRASRRAPELRPEAAALPQNRGLVGVQTPEGSSGTVLGATMAAASQRACFERCSLKGRRSLLGKCLVSSDVGWERARPRAQTRRLVRERTRHGVHRGHQGTEDVVRGWPQGGPQTGFRKQLLGRPGLGAHPRPLPARGEAP